MRQFAMWRRFVILGILTVLLIQAIAADSRIQAKFDPTGHAITTGYTWESRMKQYETEGRRLESYQLRMKLKAEGSSMEQRYAPAFAGMNGQRDSQVKAPKAKATMKDEVRQPIKKVKVIATGYTAGYESTGKRPNHPQYGITYSGVKVRRDKDTISTIAADLKVFPIGTILYIPGYGYGIVADKGSAIKGNKIDLYFKTTKQVFKEWGKKEVEVEVIRKGSGKLTEAMLLKLGKAMEVGKELPEGWEQTI